MESSSDQRKYKRLPSNLNAKVRKVQVSASELDEIRLVIKNISLGGLFIETPTPMEIDTVLRVSFHLPGSEREIQALGIVRWISNTRDMRGMGVQFLQVTTDDKDAIKQHVAFLEKNKSVPEKDKYPLPEANKNGGDNKSGHDANDGLPGWH